MQFRFGFLLVISDTVLLGDLSLVPDSFCFRSLDPDAKSTGTIELSRSLASVHFAEVAFATLPDACAELCALEALAALAVICGAVVERGYEVSSRG